MVKIQNNLNVWKIIYYFIQVMKIAEAFQVIKVNVQYVKNKFVIFVLIIKTDETIDFVICCLKREIYKLLFYDGLKYIKKRNVNDSDVKNIFKDYMFIFYFIPIVNTLNFYIKIYEFLYFCLATKNAIKSESLEFECNMDHLAKNKNIDIFNNIIIILLFLMLSICFFIFDAYVRIFIFIISTPFKSKSFIIVKNKIKSINKNKNYFNIKKF